MPEKILVTGASGFIGLNLVMRLLKEGYQVHAVSSEPKKTSLPKLLSEENINVLDITNEEKFRALISGISPDVLIHLAALGVTGKATPAEMVNVNIVGTRIALDSCKVTGTYFLNTGSCFECEPGKNMKENNKIAPLNFYGVTKAASTLLCQNYYKEGLTGSTLRLFTPFGYHEPASRLVPTLIDAALNNKTATLSSPRNVRDLIFIEDVTESYLQCIKKKPQGEIINIGSGKETSVRAAIKLVSDVTKRKLDASFGQKSRLKNEPRHFSADISKAKKVLGWKPKNTLKQGIAKTVKWYQNKPQPNQ